MDRPDFSKAVIDPAKLVRYLLALDHPEGGAKAIFFRGCGFSPDAWERFAAALRRQGAEGRVTSEVSAFGVKVIVDGPLLAEDGRVRPIRSVWIIDGGEAMPRFVTAYPLESRRAAG